LHHVIREKAREGGGILAKPKIPVRLKREVLKNSVGGETTQTMEHRAGKKKQGTMGTLPTGGKKDSFYGG